MKHSTRKALRLLNERWQNATERAKQCKTTNETFNMLHQQFSSLSEMAALSITQKRFDLTNVETLDAYAQWGKTK